MPYISKQARKVVDDWLNGSETLDEFIGQFLSRSANDDELDGMITYIFFKMLCYIYGYEGAKWAKRASAIKVAQSAIDEFKRRFLYPYEDRKRAENGDVL